MPEGSACSSREDMTWRLIAMLYTHLHRLVFIYNQPPTRSPITASQIIFRWSMFLMRVLVAVPVSMYWMCTAFLHCRRTGQLLKISMQTHSIRQTGGYTHHLGTGSPCKSVSEMADSWVKMQEAQDLLIVSDASKIRFWIQWNRPSKTITLGTSYVDMRNVSTQVPLPYRPYSSVVLLKTGTGNASPTASAGCWSNNNIAHINSYAQRIRNRSDGSIVICMDKGFRSNIRHHNLPQPQHQITVTGLVAVLINLN